MKGDLPATGAARVRAFESRALTARGKTNKTFLRPCYIFFFDLELLCNSLTHACISTIRRNDPRRAIERLYTDAIFK